jgi:hypothetical protein
MNVEAGMSPAHKEVLAKRRNQDMAEGSVNTEQNGEAEPEADGSGETELLTVDEVTITRDDEGEVQPIEVPYVMGLSGDHHKTKTVIIKPWNAQEGREYQITAYEWNQKLRDGDLERKAQYLYEDGEMVAYYMGGGPEGDDWCIPTDLALTYINDHLIKPDLPDDHRNKYNSFPEIEQDLPESMISGLYITIRMYGPGVTASGGDDDIEVVRDKKK